jgi:hypothetical protein
MGRLLSLAVVGAFSVSFLLAGSAGAVVCDPLCAPPKANANGNVRGLNRANAVAAQHGEQGRDNAAAKQDLHKPGGSGVVQTPAVPPTVTPAPEPCIGC